MVEKGTKRVPGTAWRKPTDDWNTAVVLHVIVAPAAHVAHLRPTRRTEGTGCCLQHNPSVIVCAYFLRNSKTDSLRLKIPQRPIFYIRWAKTLATVNFQLVKIFCSPPARPHIWPRRS